MQPRPFRSANLKYHILQTWIFMKHFNNYFKKKQDHLIAYILCFKKFLNFDSSRLDQTQIHQILHYRGLSFSKEMPPPPGRFKVKNVKLEIILSQWFLWIVLITFIYLTILKEVLTYKLYSVSRFEPALILNRFLADQRPGLNTLNSASGGLKKWSELPCKSEVSLQIVRGWIKWAPDCKRVRILSQFKLSCLRERILNKITF